MVWCSHSLNRFWSLSCGFPLLPPWRILPCPCLLSARVASRSSWSEDRSPANLSSAMPRPPATAEGRYVKICDLEYGFAWAMYTDYFFCVVRAPRVLCGRQRPKLSNRAPGPTLRQGSNLKAWEVHATQLSTIRPRTCNHPSSQPCVALRARDIA